MKRFFPYEEIKALDTLKGQLKHSKAWDTPSQPQRTSGIVYIHHSKGETKQGYHFEYQLC